ncbi:MAG: hypothetical protein AB1894_15465 [Chloroflexota bacterium]
MPISLTARDELTTGQVSNKLNFTVASQRLTLRELIRQRVHQEVSLYNLSTPEYFNGLVQPDETEATLNGYRLRQRRQIDWRKQAELALQAFEDNAFFVLVDDRQVESLDEIIEVEENTQVSFFKLLPLVGG